MDEQNKTKAFSAIGNKVGAAQINSTFSSNKTEKKRLEIAPLDPDLRLPKEPDPAPRRWEELFPISRINHRRQPTIEERLTGFRQVNIQSGFLPVRRRGLQGDPRDRVAEPHSGLSGICTAG